MSKTQKSQRITDLYFARFRRDFTGLCRALNKEKSKLQEVFIKPRRTEKTLMVMISARRYNDIVATLKEEAARNNTANS